MFELFWLRANWILENVLEKRAQEAAGPFPNPQGSLGCVEPKLRDLVPRLVSSVCPEVSWAGVPS